MSKNTHIQSDKPTQTSPLPTPQYDGQYSTQAAADRIDRLYLDSLARDLGYKYLGGGGR